MSKKNTLLIAIVLTCIFHSCKKSDQSINPSKLVTINTINFSLFRNVQIDLRNKLFTRDFKPKINRSDSSAQNIPAIRSSNRSANPIDTIYHEPSPLEIEVGPIINAGQAIHDQMVSQLQGSEEWNALTDEERREIVNYNESGYAALAIYFIDPTTTPSPLPNASLNITENIPDTTMAVIAPGLEQQTTNVIKNCVSFALGIAGIKELIGNTATLMGLNMAKTAAIDLLKILGKRYLSYIGIAWMIWDFMDCVAEISGPRKV